MKVVTYNVNGIRAANKLGILDWMKEYDADVYCIQEVRASEEMAKDILFGHSGQMSIFEQGGGNTMKEYHPILNCGSVAGYAGTLTLSKTKPDIVYYDMGEFWTDNEGRTTTIIIQDTAIINAYIPNGNSRLDFKMQYLAALIRYIQMLQNKYKVICVGDFNIAHNEIDLTNPRECKNKSVFLPIERKAFGEILSLDMIDVFRFKYPTKIEYSWRSYRSRIDPTYKSWKYRIDYILADKRLINNLSDCEILDLPYSDHLAVVAEFGI